MKFINVYFVLIFWFFISCSSSSDNHELVKNIKEMEINRSTDVSQWKKTFNNPDYFEFKTSIIQAMGRCRNLNYLPFYKKQIALTKSDSLFDAVIFAMGQLKSSEANKIILSLKFDSYRVKTQKTILDALVNNPNTAIRKFMETYIDSHQLKDAVYQKLGILSKNKIYSIKARNKALDSISIAEPNKYVAYYLLHSARKKQLHPLIKTLTNANGEALTLLMNACAKIVKDNGYLIKNILKSDSTLNIAFSKKYTAILSLKNQDWATQLYAINCFPSIADSAFLPAIKSMASVKNPHIRIAANAALISFSLQMHSFLLKNINTEKSMFVKSELIKILAKHFPATAYPIIHQNLGKGDNYFKANLLDAMGIIKTRDSRRFLRGYLQVPNPLLANKAFSILKRRKAIQVSDAEIMLKSAAQSSKSIAVDWYATSKYRLDTTNLIDLFTQSSQPCNLDIQRSVLNYIKSKKIEPNKDVVRNLFQKSCFYQITDSLKTMFPGFEFELIKKPFDAIPAYLNADSLKYKITSHIHIQTNKGNIVLELYPDVAPFTTRNFLKLMTKGFYNGLCFHRVVADFVIQGGDPVGDGWGGPGYIVPSEDNALPFIRGSVGIATSGYDSGSSQFFICQSAQPHLTGNYTLFGQVIEGMDIVDLIEPGDKIIQITAKAE